MIRLLKGILFCAIIWLIIFYDLKNQMLGFAGNQFIKSYFNYFGVEYLNTNDLINIISVLLLFSTIYLIIKRINNWLKFTDIIVVIVLNK